MKRENLEHIIRAAADIANDDQLIVIGSQAILAQHPDAMGALTASMEADVFPLNHPERWDVIAAEVKPSFPASRQQVV